MFKSPPKYHVGKNGPEKCGARIRKCPLQDFPTMQEAETEFRAKMEAEFEPYAATLTKKTENTYGTVEISKQAKEDCDIVTFVSNDPHLQLKVACNRPGDETAVFCRKCKRFLTKEAEKSLRKIDGISYYTCDRHEGREFDNVGDYYMHHESLKYLDERVVREETWYHVSVKSDLDETNCEFKFYVGTKQAAIERILELDVDPNDVTFYEAKLKPASKINNNIVDDDGIFDGMEPQELVQQHDELLKTGEVYRYVNMFESPGSMSLVGKRKDFELKKIGDLRLDTGETQKAHSL